MWHTRKVQPKVDIIRKIGDGPESAILFKSKIPTGLIPYNPADCVGPAKI